MDVPRSAGNRAVSEVLGATGAGPRAVQRYAAPDSSWWSLLGKDAGETAVEGAESVPLLGNAFSGGLAAVDTAAGLYDKATGDQAGADKNFSSAENFAINAIPGLGNARAGQQAVASAKATASVAEGKSPRFTGWDNWDGAHDESDDRAKLHKGVGGIGQDLGQIWDAL